MSLKSNTNVQSMMSVFSCIISWVTC